MSKIYLQEKLKGNPGQVVTFITDPDDNTKKKAVVQDAPFNASRGIILTVHAPDKYSRIIVSNGNTTLVSEPTYLEFVPSSSDSLTTSAGDSFYVTESDDRVFFLPSLGLWAVTATKSGIQTHTSINVPSTGSYEVSLSYFNAYIDVTYPMGSICTCTNGIITLTAPDTNGSCRFVVNSSGDWIVQAIGEDVAGQAIETVNVSSNEELVTVELEYVEVALNDNSWRIIKSITSKGLASAYWSLGDCKEVILNGNISNGSSNIKTFSSQSVYAYIIDFDHNADVESNSKPTLSFQLGKVNVSSFVRGDDNGTRIGFYASGFGMNKTATNAGGWRDSFMRNRFMLDFRNCLPASGSEDTLIPHLLSVKKYTDNSNSSTHNSTTVTDTYDDLFLLAPYEVFGSATTLSSVNSTESLLQTQYEYYNSSDSARFIRYRDTATSTATSWWLRSPLTSQTSYFTIVNASGGFANSSATSNNLISPVFVIGG